MRYFLPLIPFIIFFSVIFIKLISDKISSRFGNIRINYALLIIFLIPILHFPFSFINGIYLIEHPAFTSSKWLDEGVNSQDIIIQEHWEESIPRISGLNFSHERLEMYNPDTYE